MPYLNAIGLILAILIATMFVSFYATKCTHIRQLATHTAPG